ncbi:MAG: DUF6438 domain-containing protein [Sphingobium sp.]
MTMRNLAMLSALPMVLAIGGCARDRPELEKPVAAGDIIGFTAGPCLGRCPSYSLTVTPDGSGLLTPQRFTAVPGPTRFTVSAAQYRRLRVALAPYRPTAGTVKRIANGENCARFATDMPAYTIQWSRGAGKPARLEFQSGCMDARYARLRTAIGAVPRLLEIEPMLRPGPAR